MVTKSKLKMALSADKGVDYKNLNLKKKEKAARKVKAQKGGDKPKSKGKKVEEETKDSGLDMSGEESGSDEEEGGAETGPMQARFPLLALSENVLTNSQIDFEGIDESDSDSSAGENDQENESEDDEDEEDIPVSDLEDLDEEEKEDMIPHQRLTINNTVALTAALKRIALPTSKLPFSEHQSITTSAPVTIADVSDDLNRELAFYAQSLSAAQEARKLLKAEGVLFTRPTDYFAEMVKADEHMAKIKAKLIDEAASKKASAEARKQRDLKKFGKQVQVAKLQERDKERKQTMEKIKVLKRSTFPSKVPLDALY
jgi:rRNA-processing protein EBP2